MHYVMGVLAAVIVFGVLGFFYVLDNGSGGSLPDFFDTVARPMLAVGFGVTAIFQMARMTLRDAPELEDRSDDR